MFTKRQLSALALAVVVAAPLAAQGDAREARRRTDAAREQTTSGAGRTARRQTDAAQDRAAAVLSRAQIDSIRIARRETSVRTSRASRIPRGHLPPRGMCRVWIDGVPPGHQPPVTSCAQAERDRLALGTNARVIYGDVESFPGRGKGKFKNRDASVQGACVTRDAVVVGDRVVNVCRDANGNVIDRKGRVVRDGDDDDDDDDRFENDNRGQSSLTKAQKQERKAARKGNKGRG